MAWGLYIANFVFPMGISHAEIVIIVVPTLVHPNLPFYIGSYTPPGSNG